MANRVKTTLFNVVVTNHCKIIGQSGHNSVRKLDQKLIGTHTPLTKRFQPQLQLERSWKLKCESQNGASSTILDILFSFNISL